MQDFAIHTFFLLTLYMQKYNEDNHKDNYNNNNHNNNTYPQQHLL